MDDSKELIPAQKLQIHKWRFTHDGMYQEIPDEQGLYSRITNGLKLDYIQVEVVYSADTLQNRSHQILR